MSEIFLFPTEFVFWKNVDSDRSLTNKLMLTIKDQEPKLKEPWNTCNAKSTMGDNNLNQFLKTDEVYETLIWDPFQDMIDKIRHQYSEVPAKSIVKDIWYNHYQEGQFQEVHNHVSGSLERNGREYHCLFVLIHILKQTGSNKTCFRKPAPNTGYYPVDSVSMFSDGYDDIGEGTTLIFPAHLDHYVLPADGERITISANLYSTFT